MKAKRYYTLTYGDCQQQRIGNRQYLPMAFPLFFITSKYISLKRDQNIMANYCANTTFLPPLYNKYKGPIWILLRKYRGTHFCGNLWRRAFIRPTFGQRKYFLPICRWIPIRR